MSNETENKAAPAYRIYSVSKNGDKKAIWKEIGAAWANKDGKGLNLVFSARPLEGAQIVLREPKEPTEKTKKTEKTKTKGTRGTAGRYDSLKGETEANA
jgi:hypothetical protein